MEQEIVRKGIFLVEDHPVVCQGLEAVIAREVDLEVRGTAQSADEAQERISELNIDLAVVDLTLKGSSGLELIKSLRGQYPLLRILVISVHDETVYARRALRAGAHGYLMKCEAVPHIVEALRCVLGGGIYVSEEMESRILNLFVKGVLKEPSAECLSDREMEVFQRIGQGLSMKKIAEELNLSVKTVESYRAHIKEKLNMKTAADLAEYAREVNSNET